MVAGWQQGASVLRLWPASHSLLLGFQLQSVHVLQVRAGAAAPVTARTDHWQEHGGRAVLSSVHVSQALRQVAQNHAATQVAAKVSVR